MDLHFPLSVCGGRWYFSYESDSHDELPNLLAALTHPPVLIRRGAGAGSASSAWSGALAHDLQQVREPWIFHLMDDAAIAEKVPPAALASVLDAASYLNASLVGLYRFMYASWNSRRLPLQRAPLPEALAGVLGGISLWRASEHSRFVVQQNFALWRTDVLLRSLVTVGKGASPQQWEKAWNDGPNRNELVRTSAYVAQYAQPHSLQGILDAGHRGRIISGWCGCAWARAMTCLGLDSRAASHDTFHSSHPMTALPAHNLLQSPHYSWCTRARSGCNELRAPPGCSCDLCRRCTCNNQTS